MSDDGKSASVVAEIMLISPTVAVVVGVGVVGAGVGVAAGEAVAVAVGLDVDVGVVVGSAPSPPQAKLLDNRTRKTKVTGISLLRLMRLPFATCGMVGMAYVSIGEYANQLPQAG